MSKSVFKVKTTKEFIITLNHAQGEMLCAALRNISYPGESGLADLSDWLEAELGLDTDEKLCEFDERFKRHFS